MILYILLTLLLGILIGLLLFYFLNRRLISSAARTRVETAKYSEAEAEKLLVKQGFTILEKQKRTPLIVWVDGKSHLSYVLADFLVQKDKKTYVVEVKTGQAADPTEPATRRQLLEYEYVYRPDGLLLLDMNLGELHEVDFELPRAERENFLAIFLPLFIILIIIGIIWLLIQLKLF
jgi:hypothetical protein